MNTSFNTLVNLITRDAQQELKESNNIPFQIVVETLRTENKVTISFIPWDSDTQYLPQYFDNPHKSVSYEYSNWWNDLWELEKRTLILWIEKVAQEILKNIQNDRLIKFVWNGILVYSNAIEITEAKGYDIGKILHQIEVKNYDSSFLRDFWEELWEDHTSPNREKDTRTILGTLLLCEEALVLVHGTKNTEIEVYKHEDIFCDFDLGILSIITEKTMLELIAINEFDRDDDNNFLRQIKKRLPAKYFEKHLPSTKQLFDSCKHEMVISQREKIIKFNRRDDLRYLLHSYYSKGDYSSTIEIADLLFKKDLFDIYTYDSVTPAYLHSGKFKELIKIFEQTNDHFIETWWVVVSNFLGNMVVPYAALEKFDELKDFTSKYYKRERKHANRLYFHNFACALCIEKNFTDAKEAILIAIDKWETEHDIFWESDFQELLTNDTAFVQDIHEKLNNKKEV